MRPTVSRRYGDRATGQPRGMKAVTWHGKRDVRVDTVPDPHDRGAHRRDHHGHVDRHLRLRPAPLRGARRVHRRGRHPRPRADGHRRGGRLRGQRHQGRRPRRHPVQHLLRPLLDVRAAACTRSARPRRCASRARARRCSATPSCTAQVPGGQAEYLRVPQAQFGPIKVPEGPPDERFVYLSDVLPTAWQARGVRRRPRGRHASPCSAWARSARWPARIAQHRGAGRVIGVDLVPERLELAPRATASRRSTCASTTTLGDALRELTDGRGPRLGDRRGRHGGPRRPARRARPERRPASCPTRSRAADGEGRRRPAGALLRRHRRGPARRHHLVCRRLRRRSSTRCR